MLNRRTFLRIGSTFTASAFVGTGAWQHALADLFLQTGPGPYGSMQGTPDANGIRLPAGFTSRVIATSDEVVPGTSYVWHPCPDGGATFKTGDGGWIYVSNAEDNDVGGASSVRFDVSGNIIDAYRICSGTSNNCAGGATPWDTWLSCEEVGMGLVWECDPFGILPAVSRPAMGRFKHEAVAVDHNLQQLYLTEDKSDGGFYRFLPDTWQDLSSGTLQIAEVIPAGGVGPGGQVVWHDVPNPDPGGGTETRYQVPETSPFSGGEGITYNHGRIYFTTKIDQRVWQYDPTTQDVCVFYESASDPELTLLGPDNITGGSYGDLLVAEDNGNMELVLISKEGTVSSFLRVLNQASSEVTGPAFNHRENRLYFSSQRGGPSGTGITYEITGPFRKMMSC